MEANPERRDDPQDLIRLAEWEIKRLEDAKKEQGWSPWMLYVALAGLLWKSVDEFAQRHTWTNVWLYWAAFTLLLNFGSDVVRLLMSRPREKAASPRFFAANRLLGGTRPYLIFVALKVTVAALLVWFLSPLAGWAKSVWGAMFGFHFLGWILMLAISFFDLPMLVSGDRAHIAVRAGGSIAYVLHLIAMAIMCVALWAAFTTTFLAPDLKLALIFFAASEIVSLLLSHHIVNPIRDNLVQLRRALGLGEIGYDDAKARLDLALHGAQITKYLQPWVQRFLSVLDDVTREQDTIVRLIDATKEKLRAEPTPESVKTLDTSLNQTQVHTKSVARLLKQAMQTIEAFNLRVNSVEASDERIAADVRPLRESMTQQLTAATDRSQKLERELAEQAKAIEDFRRRAASDSGPPPGRL